MDKIQIVEIKICVSVCAIRLRSFQLLSPNSFLRLNLWKSFLSFHVLPFFPLLPTADTYGIPHRAGMHNAPVKCRNSERKTNGAYRWRICNIYIYIYVCTKTGRFGARIHSSSREIACQPRMPCKLNFLNIVKSTF